MATVKKRMATVKKIFLVICFVVAMHLIPNLALAQTNLVTNGSFETGNTNGWYVVNLNGAASSVTAETAADGRYSYKIVHDPKDPEGCTPGSDWSSIGQNILGKIEPNKLYKFRFAYKTSYQRDNVFDVRLGLANPSLLLHSSHIIGLGPVPQAAYYQGEACPDRYPWYPDPYQYMLAPLIADGKWHYIEAVVSRTEVFLQHEPCLAFYFDYGAPGTIYVDDFQVIPCENIPPTTTADLPDLVGGSEWYTSDVQISLEATDNDGGSGVAKIEYSFDGQNWVTYTAPFTMSTEATTALYYRSVDKDGNVEATKQKIIKIDKKAPSTIINLKRVLGDNGWCTSNVQVALTAVDDISGIAKTEYSFNGIDWIAYASPFTISTEGITTIYYRSTDNAGNSEVTKEEIVKIDKTAPVITVSKPENGAKYLLNQNVLADWLAADPISDVFSTTATFPNGREIDTTSVGAKNFSVTATDYAGNRTTETATYYVHYNHSGVLQPINADGSSTFKLGRTIPVKFQLKDTNAHYISTAVAKIYLSKISNNITGPEQEGISTSAATEGNLFRYDSENNQYIFNLATGNLSNGIWQIRIELDDGTSEYVKISLK